MITHYFLKDNHLIETEDIKESLWLHVEKPTTAEIEQLSKKYELPKDYLTSILDDAENSRAEGLNQENFLIPALLLLQFPYVSTSPSGYLQFNTYPLALIITPEKKLLTVCNYHMPFFKTILEKPLPKNDMSNKLNLVLQILWHLAFTYNQNLADLKRQVDKLEGQIQVSTENKHLYQLMDIQKSLVLFEAATKANFKTLTKLANTNEFQNHHAYQNHLHDILVETKQSVTTAKINLQLVSQMNETFSAIVSNNLNIVMKILTSLTIVLTIPTIIGGIYGMNVKLPFAKSDYAFLLITGVTILICYLVIKYLKKRNLL
ncbi:magnesium transporter [Enterococcus saigonensis]|uniref:Magnesium transporter n=1 Tax=Enterococcus saigonensis TaxID=1805431 RepID=A0A679IIS1_9ENTE|nr:magnesium transporter CorA family protein [Enterococcus saigonensis]BCA85305.1 magnesium transporter [Enterococcus saigonensis]